MDLIYKFVFTTALLAVVVSASPKIGQSLQQHFLLGDEAEPQSVMVSFSKEITTVIDQINSQRFVDMAEKRSALREAQILFANENQRSVQTALKFFGIEFETFWINNKMHIPRADYRIVKLLARLPTVLTIEKEVIATLSLPANAASFDGLEEEDAPANDSTKLSSATWGVSKIRAPQVWQTYNGQGIVVANIDTGVRGSHQALKSNWRSTYGWYDPFYKSTTPNDAQGHGTHTMGTIAGQNGIGVAPGSTWIACRGCSTVECSESALTSCGQWVLCPTLPNGSSKNCAMAPNVVSNSWGQDNAPNEAFYNGVIQSWHAGGIIPVFALGNSGPSCGTAGSPGNQGNNIAVGNTDSHERIARSSSRGPNKANQIRPDIAAPGSDIKSAGHRADSQYVSQTGTSMSCPHVAGVVALMLQKNPDLTYKQVYKAITSTAATKSLNLTGAQTCGGIPSNQFPNCVFGYGRIDAAAAVNAI